MHRTAKRATQAKLDEILTIVSTTKIETIGAEHLPLNELKLLLQRFEEQSEVIHADEPK